jgi:hypothetical protein
MSSPGSLTNADAEATPVSGHSSPSQLHREAQRPFPRTPPAHQRSSPASTSSPPQRAATSQVTVHSSHTFYSTREVNASVDTHNGAAADARYDDALAAADTSFLSSAQALQMVADLKSELFHATRQLTQAHQHARASEEVCTELRQRCQGLEVERQTLTLQLQEAQDRLQARQIRLDEHRREAAEATLRVVSLTAERDELAAKVQEAWDRVAELSAGLRSREEDLKDLREEVLEVRHEKELVVQQHTMLQSQLNSLQEQLNADGDDARTHAAARERLRALLHDATQRLAGVLSDVAYNYQRSITEDDSSDRALPFRITSAHSYAGVGSNEEETTTSSGVASAAYPPHVVLSPAFRPPTTPPPPSHTAEAARLHAESLLHNAEAVVWGGSWEGEEGEGDQAEEATLPRSPLVNDGRQGQSPSPYDDAGEGQQQSSEGVTTSSTPPERAFPPAARQTLVRRRPTASPSATRSALPHEGMSSEQIVVRTALAPILLAMKHVAATLGAVRHQQQRTTAEVAHYKKRYQEAQQQLETVQGSLRALESQSGASREQERRLRQELIQAEAALQQCQRENAERRLALAHILQCRDDWALIHHSVERLRVRLAELQKDVAQLQGVCSAEREKARTGEEHEVYVKEGSTLGQKEEESEEQHQQSTSSREAQHTEEAAHSNTAWSSVQGQLSQETTGTSTMSRKAYGNAVSPSQQSVADRVAMEPTQLPCSSVHVKPSLDSPSFIVDRIPPSPQHGRGSITAATAEAEADTGGSYASERVERPAGVFADSVESHPAQQSAPLVPSPLPASSPLTVAPSSAAVPPSVQPTRRASSSAVGPMGGYPGVSVSGPVRRVYPTPLAEDSPLPLSPSRLPLYASSTAERLLLHSLCEDRKRRDSPPPPAARDAVHPLHTGDVYFSANAENSSSHGGVDQPSMFAAEVLQVIEALDRRVSGALQRAARP